MIHRAVARVLARQFVAIAIMGSAFALVTTANAVGLLLGELFRGGVSATSLLLVALLSPLYGFLAGVLFSLPLACWAQRPSSEWMQADWWGVVGSFLGAAFGFVWCYQNLPPTVAIRTHQIDSLFVGLIVGLAIGGLVGAVAGELWRNHAST